MGVLTKIDDKRVHSTSYRVTESSTPLAGGDSSGSVGSIEISTENVPLLPAGMNVGDSISLIDTYRGSTLGTIREVGDDENTAGGYSVSADTRLGEFVIEARVSPFTGRLEDAFRYYCSLANIDTNIVVDNALANIQVNWPGWSGNLWNQLKEMATAVGADLNLISNNIVLRPVRLFEAIQDRNTDTSVTTDGLDLALKQEVMWYQNEYVPNGLIYPSGGFRTDITPLSVAAGETQEYTLDSNSDVNSSIFSIIQPVPVNSLGPNDNTTSAYAVIADDNIIIPAAQWTAFGGKVEVEIGEDSRSLIVRITGAQGLYTSKGVLATTFRLAVSADSTTSTYQALRIVGSHISIKQNSLILPTGVPEFRTGQEFAPTIDNQFITSLEAAYTAGVRGARRYAGRNIVLSANVVSLNRRGETGTANYPPYSYAQNLWGGLTYATVKTLRTPGTYADTQNFFYAQVQDSFDNQVFGNAPGARFYDRKSARWYRIRNSTVEYGTISVDGDNDLLNGDIQRLHQGRTYALIASQRFSGLTYHKANLKGMA